MLSALRRGAILIKQRLIWKKLYSKGLAALRAQDIGNLQIPDNLIIKEMIDFSHTGIADKEQEEFTAEGKMRLTAIAVDPEIVKSALLTGQENMVLSKESIEQNRRSYFENIFAGSEKQFCPNYRQNHHSGQFAENGPFYRKISGRKNSE